MLVIMYADDHGILMTQCETIASNRCISKISYKQCKSVDAR